MADDLNNNTILHPANIEVESNYQQENILRLNVKKEDKLFHTTTPTQKKNWFVRNWKYILGIAITFSLMGYLIWRSNPSTIWETISQSNYLLILASFGGTLILFAIKTIRWKFILKSQDLDLPFFVSFPIIVHQKSSTNQ